MHSVSFAAAYTGLLQDVSQVILNTQTTSKQTHSSHECLSDVRIEPATFGTIVWGANYYATDLVIYVVIKREPVSRRQHPTNQYDSRNFIYNRILGDWEVMASDFAVPPDSAID